MNSLQRFFQISAFALFSSILLAGCQPPKTPHCAAVAVVGTAFDTVGEKDDFQFPYVEIPGLIEDSDEQIIYLSQHFWDRLNFADTLYLTANREILTAFARYLQLLDQLAPDYVSKSVSTLVQKADTTFDALRYLRKKSEEILYDPNSPLRNDEIYSCFLEAYLQARHRNIEAEPRDRKQLQIVHMNQVGAKANDFSFITPQGEKLTLQEVDAPYLVLYFYNPGCHGCQQISEALKRSEIIRIKSRASFLKVLAVYPDEDEKGWKESLSELPSEWLKGYDKKQRLETVPLYDLKAMPTLYLLDSRKKVLLKDTDVPTLEQYLKKF